MYRHIYTNQSFSYAYRESTVMYRDDLVYLRKLLSSILHCEDAKALHVCIFVFRKMAGILESWQWTSTWSPQKANGHPKWLDAEAHHLLIYQVRQLSDVKMHI